MSLVLGDNFDYKSQKPLDARLKYNTLAEMKAVADATMYDGCLAYCSATGMTYQWKSTNEVDSDTGRWREFSSGSGGTSDYSELTNKPQINGVTLTGNKTYSDLSLQKTIQISSPVAPTPAVMDRIFHYIGDDTSGYHTQFIHGYFYECYFDTSTSTYKWRQVNVQSAGTDYSELTNKPQINSVTLTGNKTYSDLDLQRTMQLPSTTGATSLYENRIYQYTGSDTTDVGVTFTHGHFYECYYDSSSSKYKWREVNVGSGASYTAGDGIDITNNVISTKQSEEGDIDEIIDVYPTAGELVSIVNAFNRGDIYSTDEKMIGQWYDGKPLYQKTLAGTISVDTDKTSKNTTIGNISEDLDVVVSIDGIREHENKSVFVSLSVSSALTNNSVYVCNLFVNNSTGNLVLEDNRLADDGRIVYATVKYTKTTDTAISIGSTTEYSTGEKVVGTWLDGKPIYQRTFTVTIESTSDGNWKSTQVNVSGWNIDSVVDIHCMGHSTTGNWVTLDSMTITNGGYILKTTIDNNKTTFTIWNNAAAYSGTTIYATVRYTKTT